jgi:hypothetical protein
MDIRDTELADTLTVTDEPKSAANILEAIEDSERAFHAYNDYCRRVDNALSSKGNLDATSSAMGYTDQEYDIFWASMEILKPAIYARPPKPVATPRFKDGRLIDKTVAELIERNVYSEFDRSDIDQAMLSIRDDLATTNRGVAWVTYESDGKGGGKRVCVEHLDRMDFLHEPARKWSEVGWVARRAWMTRTEMKKRFPGNEGWEEANYAIRREDRDSGGADLSAKASVWEVWSRVDNKVYWVSEGVAKILEESEPYMNLRGFFPCPRPAYGTLVRRTLIPVPDYRRYEGLIEQIDEATSKIYDWLYEAKLKGFVPAGGDVGSAIKTALEANDTTTIIPLPGAAFAAGSASGFIAWMPLDMITAAIQGMLEARREMINNFYELSGISDIMRGATEAQETYGAQRLKSQYGSIRVREKIDEMVRLARDIAYISAEIISDNFDQDLLLETAQMDIPSRREVEKSIRELKQACEDELTALMEGLQDQPPPPPEAPEQAAQMEQQFQEAQKAILAKYQPQLDQLGKSVVIEDVMKILKDDKIRNLVIDIETDSTVLTDEVAEKQSRAEFLTAFANATQSVQSLLQAGEAGAQLAGGLLKFVLAPYHANRELDSLIDAFIEKAPEFAAAAAGEGENDGLIEAQNKLAEAEQMKAQATMEGVKARAMKDQADMHAKLQQMEVDTQEKVAKMQLENQKLQLASQKQEQEFQAKMADMDAKQNLMQAQTAEILNKIGLDVRKQDLAEYQEARAVEQTQVDTALKVTSEERANRQQEVSEVQGERQMTMQERAAMQQDQQKEPV